MKKILVLVVMLCLASCAGKPPMPVEISQAHADFVRALNIGGAP